MRNGRGFWTDSLGGGSKGARRPGFLGFWKRVICDGAWVCGDKSFGCIALRNTAICMNPVQLDFGVQKCFVLVGAYIHAGRSRCRVVAMAD
jgi:hypothetical protein